VDLAAEQPTLTIGGTIVHVKGKGFFRQGWTKTDAGYSTVVVPVGSVAPDGDVKADLPIRG
jgi:hypothetical protein